MDKNIAIGRLQNAIKRNKYNMKFTVGKYPLKNSGLNYSEKTLLTLL